MVKRQKRAAAIKAAIEARKARKKAKRLQREALADRAVRKMWEHHIRKNTVNGVMGTRLGDLLHEAGVKPSKYL